MEDPNTVQTSPGRAGAKRSRLGRGLQAMIEPTPAVVVEAPREEPGEEPGEGAGGGAAPGPPHESEGGDPSDRVPGARVREIACASIDPNPNQPRRSFDDAALAALAASIEAHGILQPITVRAGGGGRYELIAGERRWRAAQRAGLGTIPAIVRDADDRASAQLALIENIQREDLDPIERATALRDLAERHGMTQERIARAVGVSRPSVANTIRLLELPETVIGMLRSGELSVGHAKVLLSESDHARLESFARRVRDRGWNVRTLEHEMRQPARSGSDAADPAPDAGAPSRASEVLRDLERRLGEALGTRVRVRTSGDGTRGRVEIAFYDLDQFDGLLGRLGVEDRA